MTWWLRETGSGRIVMPAPVNAHDHGYGIRTLDFGAVDDALEPWIAFMRLRPRTDAYLEALVGFARLAHHGIGATMHCHNSLNAERMVEEAQAVCRAAMDIGIRLGLSCPLLDLDPWAYGGGPQRLKRFMDRADWDRLAPSAPRYRPIADQLAAVDAIAELCDSEMVSVQLGPVGPQWCSDALLEAIAQASALQNRRIHMHLLESPRQRSWLDRRFPQGVMRFLDDMGFLSSRLSVAHGVQLRDDELDLMAERGVQLVSNPTANLRLRSGIAPIGKAVAAGVAVAVGLDGTGLDDDQDWWRELRLFHLLHAGTGLDPRQDHQRLLDGIWSAGAQVLSLPSASDTVSISRDALLADSPLEDHDLPSAILSRMTGAAAVEMDVAGRPVLRDGKLVNVDFAVAREELRLQARADGDRLERERANAAILAAAIRRYYASEPFG